MVTLNFEERVIQTVFPQIDELIDLNGNNLNFKDTFNVNLLYLLTFDMLFIFTW